MNAGDRVLRALSVTGLLILVPILVTDKVEAQASFPICLVGYSWEAGQSKQVVYLTADGHIHELYVGLGGGSWQHADLTALAGAPRAEALGNGYSWEVGKSKQVVYVTDRNRIHELYVGLGGSWQHANLTGLAGAPASQKHPIIWISGYSWETGQSKQVVYVRSGGGIHELHVTQGGHWQYANLTNMAGGVRADTLVNGYSWEAG